MPHWDSALARMVEASAPEPDTHRFRSSRLAARSRIGRAQAETFPAFSAACSMISKSAGFTRNRITASCRWPFGLGGRPRFLVSIVPLP